METFITLIDDPDVDIKMVADECLNRVIRVRSFIYTVSQKKWTPK